MSTSVLVTVKDAGTVSTVIVVAAGVVTVVDTTTVEMGTSPQQKADARGSELRTETASAKQLQSEDEAAAETATASTARIEVRMSNGNSSLKRCWGRNHGDLYVDYPSPLITILNINGYDGSSLTQTYIDY
jgi:hypothetical protein